MSDQLSVADFLLVSAKVYTEEKTAIRKCKTEPETKNYVAGKLLQHTKGKMEPKIAYQLVDIMVNNID